MKKYTRFLALLAALLMVGLDQLTKWLAATYLQPVYSIPLITIGEKEWLNLTYVENYGAAFSILQNKHMFLIIITSVVIVAVAALIISGRVKRPSYIWSFSVILAGGMGNLIDRIVHGYVIDFIDVRIIHFAIFNVADICAVVGTGMLIIFMLLGDKKDKKSAKDVEQEADGTETVQAVVSGIENLTGENTADSPHDKNGNV